MDLRIEPIQVDSWPAALPTAGLVNNPIRTAQLPTAPDLLTLVSNIHARITEEILNLGADPETKRANLERLRAEREAERIIRKALREEAAAEARVRQKQREEAAIERAAEGRIRLAYSASELHEILQTAKRLNIQV